MKRNEIAAGGLYAGRTGSRRQVIENAEPPVGRNPDDGDWIAYRSDHDTSVRTMTRSGFAKWATTRIR